METIECPICHKEFESLYLHLRKAHNLSDEYIKSNYNNIRLFVDKRKRTSIKCEFCDKEFVLLNAFHSHLKYKHPEEYTKLQENINKNITEEDTITCKICNKKFKSLSEHLNRKHNMKFEDYCVNYEYIGPKKIFTNKHKESLSKNKVIFYNTDRGNELRAIQSYKMKNIRKSEAVRKKMSDTMYIEYKNKNTRIDRTSYGLNIRFTHKEKSYSTRSFEEFKFIQTLLVLEIPFEYEYTRIVYYDENNNLRTYIPDFKVQNNIFEIKNQKNIEKLKYTDKFIKVNEVVNNLGIKLFIGNYIDCCDELNINEFSKGYFIERLKEYMQHKDFSIQYMIKKGYKPRLLELIDKNYINNDKLQVKYFKPKGKT